MRRPGPLPAEQTAKPEPAPRRTAGRRAPAATTAAAENSAPASGQPQADELFGGPDILPAPRPLGSTAPGRAPAQPMTAPEALTAPPTARPADVERDESEDDPTGIGVRDVWAAARARRRALRAEVRRFTVRQRRRRMLWGGTLAALLLLVLGTLGAAYSPLFAVEQVSVVGTSTLDAGAVEAALAGQIGTPLPLVDSSSVKAVLVTFPLVESYTLEARPPHELVVRIVERTPIGSIQSAAGYTLVDAAGSRSRRRPSRRRGIR